MDVAFLAYMKNDSYSEGFVGATTDPPSDAVIYNNTVAALQQRLKTVMNGWESFEEMLGLGSTWTGPVEPAAAFAGKWTAGSTTSATA